MDDLESAVLLCLNPPADVQLHARALQFCQNLRQSQDGFAFVLQRLSPNMRPEVAFWCLQVIQETVSDPNRYPAPFSLEQVVAVRAKVLEMFARAAYPGGTANGNAQQTGMRVFPRFLVNKITQVFVSLIAADYPIVWKAAFQETVLPLARVGEHAGYAVAMFFRTLRTLDEDVTSVRATQISDATRKTATRVKDAMRDDCISEIVARCSEYIASPTFVSQAFDIVARYVEWVDIGLIVQDGILTPMYRAVGSVEPCAERPAAAAALRAIVTKRMDAPTKINLLTTLRIEELLRAIPVVQICNIEGELGDAELGYQPGRMEVAALVNTIAVCVLEILKDGMKERLDAKNSAQVSAAAGRIAQIAIPVALRFLDENSDEGTSSQTLQCVTTYVNVFSRLTQSKKNGTSTEGISAMRAILKVVEERSLFPKDYDPQDDKSDKQKAFLEVRRVLIKSIFRSVVRSFPDMCLEFVNGLFARAVETGDVLRVELALSTLIAFVTVSPDNAQATQLRRKVIASPPSCMNFETETSPQSVNEFQIAQIHQLELVSTTYFDLVARSYRLFLSQPDPVFLTTALAVFFDRRGLGHPSSQIVRSHAAYSLLKLSKPLRSIIINTDLDAILGAIRPYMFPLKTDVGSQDSKDQMAIYETVGYLLGTDCRKEGCRQYLAAILSPLIGDLQKEGSPVALPCIMASGFLSKGFGGDSKPLLLPLNETNKEDSPDANPKTFANNSEGSGKDVKVQRVTPLVAEMQEVWVRCLEAVLKAATPSLNAPRDAYLTGLRSKLLFFLHRMVDTIGSPVLPYLDVVLPRLLNSSESSVELRDAIILASQAVTKFGEASEGLATSVYAPIISNVRMYRYSLDPKTLMAISEESRETVEMHRAYTYFMHAIVGSELVKLLVIPTHVQLTQEVMDSIMSNAIGRTLDLRVAGSVMKMSLHMLRQLVERWTGSSPAPNSPPGFSSYALKEIPDLTIRCCLEGSIFRAGDYESGQAIAVLTEIVALQRLGASRFGQTFGEELRAGRFASLAAEDSKSYITALYDPNIPALDIVSALATLSKGLRTR